MGGWSKDVVFVVRSLARRRALASVSIGTLALAIGAATVLFSVARAVLLQPLPFHEPDRLVRIWESGENDQGIGATISFPNARDVGVRSGSVDDVALLDEWQPGPALEGDGAQSEVVAGATVSANFFDLLGVQTVIGRTFRAEEEGEGREPVVVLGHGLWTRRFAADPGVLGRSIVASGNTYTVIGVLSSDFESPGLEGASFDPPEIWRTVAAFPPYRSGRSWAALGRLRADVDLEAARQELSAVSGALAAEHPEENARYRLRMAPLRDHLLGDAARLLPILMGAVGLVLLVACANVAGLLMVRSGERRDELDLRMALGASRTRLAVSALLDGLVVSVCGTAAGVVLAAVALPFTRRMVEGVLPRTEGIALDASVLIVAALAALVTGLACGIAPARAALRRAGAGAARRSAGRSSSPGLASSRARRILVASQVAVSVTLLVGGGIMLRSLESLYGVDLGLERNGVLAVELHSAAFGALPPDEAGARYEQIMRGLRALPGVQDAGAINIAPLSRGFSCDGVQPLDQEPDPEGRCAEIRVVLPGALEAMRIPLVTGRRLTSSDGPDTPGAMVVSRSMAEAFWPGEEALGRRATIHERVFEVVGIAGDVRLFGPDGGDRPQVYLPAAQEPWGGFYYPFTLLVSTDGEPTSLLGGVRRVLDEADPRIAITDVATMDGLLDELLARPRFQTAILAAFALLAVLLAMVGLGGMLATSVRQRRREIGLRVALGAAPLEVAAMVTREGTALVGAGAVVGLGIALLAGDLLSSFVFGVGVRDPWTLLGTVTLVLTLGLLTSWAQARRAASVDPVEALASD